MVLRTYCLACKNIQIILLQVILTNEVIRDKSRCSECLSDKSRFIKQKHNKKVVSSIIKQTC